MACSARTFLAVSVATPTKMRTEVPAKPLKACNLVNISTSDGAAESAPKNAEPKTDIRSSVPEMYAAVALPGLTAGMEAPCLFS